QRDGRALYFIVQDDHDQIYSHDRIGIASWPWDGEAKILTASFDRSVSSFAPAADRQAVYMTAEDLGLEKVYVVPARGGETTLAVAPARGVYTNLRISSDTAMPVIVANWGSAIDPTEIVRIDPVTKQHRLLTT